jgi:hypothetical protein
MTCSPRESGLNIMKDPSETIGCSLPVTHGSMAEMLGSSVKYTRSPEWGIARNAWVPKRHWCLLRNGNCRSTTER